MPGYILRCELAHPEFEHIELKMDEVVDCLEDYLVIAAASRARGERERDAEVAIRELRKVIAMRGKVLFVQKRKKRMGETYLAIADPPDA